LIECDNLRLALKKLKNKIFFKKYDIIFLNNHFIKNMKIIEKIEIRFFRSIKRAKIQKINEVNIFSGVNDSGKSNILKALNLFFIGETDFLTKLDFANDFNKSRLNEVQKDSIKGKKFISIKIHFLAPLGYKNLPAKFCVGKSWDKDGNLLSFTDNVSLQLKKNNSISRSETASRRALTSFLNSIHYLYTPAVRSFKIFENLLNLLQELILYKNSKNKKILSSLLELNQETKKFTSKISEDFKKISGISSGINAPNEFKEFFKSFVIDTETGKFNIPLRFRGDGIQMRYIPTILDYISKNSKGFFVWGFDEPENSTEYSLCSKMANDFKNIFSKNSQIFISTHSFHFTTLSGNNISKYRVYKDNESINSLIGFIRDDNKLDVFAESEGQKLSEEIGVLDLHKKIAEEYNEWNEQKENIKKDLEFLNQQIYKNDNKPVLFVEGKTDKKILETAWKKLKSKKDMPFFIENKFDCYSIVNTFKRGDIYQNNLLFIGMLDFDDAFDKWSELINIDGYSVWCKNKKEGVAVKHSNNKGFVFLLPVPDIRKKYADTHYKKSYLSIELLFDDKLIKKYCEEKEEAGGVKFLKFKNTKKDAFSKEVDKFKKENFVNFVPIFDLIDKIINESQE